jgi:hypothetical protein
MPDETPKPDLAFIPAPTKSLTPEERRAYAERIVEAARASIRAEWEAAQNREPEA